MRAGGKKNTNIHTKEKAVKPTDTVASPWPDPGTSRKGNVRSLPRRGVNGGFRTSFARRSWRIEFRRSFLVVVVGPGLAAAAGGIAPLPVLAGLLLPLLSPRPESESSCFPLSPWEWCFSRPASNFFGSDGDLFFNSENACMAAGLCPSVRLLRGSRGGSLASYLGVLPCSGRALMPLLPATRRRRLSSG